MKRYTIGAILSADFKQILLIEKQKPDWQKGKLNFPGGSIEEGESPAQCVSREFHEECNIYAPTADWDHIGIIESELGYTVDFFVTIHMPRHGEPKTTTNEKIGWYEVGNLPLNIISNLSWLVPFAVNCLKQGNHDALTFGTFKYTNL